jgi:hypothetical protein
LPLYFDGALADAPALAESDRISPPETSITAAAIAIMHLHIAKPPDWHAAIRANS